eukprot:3074486-Prorocentrum_lima.AAC.1
MLLADILKAGPTDPRYHMNFEDSSLRVRTDERKRVGRPRLSWPIITLQELWKAVSFFRRQYRWESFNPDNQEHVDFLCINMQSPGFPLWLKNGGFDPTRW